MTRPFDRERDLALHVCRVIQTAARQNFAPLIDAAAQARDVLVIDDIVIGENRFLAPPAAEAWTARTAPAPTPTGTRWPRIATFLGGTLRPL